MINEHDRVILTATLLAEGLEPGDVGTVVHIYGNGTAFEVEFIALDGHTKSVVTLEAKQIRSVTSQDMTHARELHAS